jgi:hypothetical protein
MRVSWPAASAASGRPRHPLGGQPCPRLARWIADGRATPTPAAGASVAPAGREGSPPAPEAIPGHPLVLVSAAGPGGAWRSRALPKQPRRCWGAAPSRPPRASRESGPRRPIRPVATHPRRAACSTGVSDGLRRFRWTPRSQGTLGDKPQKGRRPLDLGSHRTAAPQPLPKAGARHKRTLYDKFLREEWSRAGEPDASLDCLEISLTPAL